MRGNKMEWTTKQNGEYTNHDPDWTSIGINEEVAIMPLELVREGTSSKDGRSFNWAKFKFIVDGKEWIGFPPRSNMIDKLKQSMGKELKVKKTIYIDQKGQERVGYVLIDNTPINSSNPNAALFKKAMPSLKVGFTTKDDELKNGNEIYSTKEVIEAIKSEKGFDNEATYIQMFNEYGGTNERAKEVFNNRHKV
jgi:hypothetical protein